MTDLQVKSGILQFVRALQTANADAGERDALKLMYRHTGLKRSLLKIMADSHYAK